MSGKRNNFEQKQKRCYIYFTATIDSSRTVEGITVVRIKTIKLKKKKTQFPRLLVILFTFTNANRRHTQRFGCLLAEYIIILL